MSYFEFEHPFALLLLTLIICIYRCPVSIKQLTFPHTNLFRVSTNFINKERFFYSIILALLITALAFPISYEQKSSTTRKGRDLVFVLDTSGSMSESGFEAQNPQKKKFELIKELLKEFISQRYDDNVGITIFGSYAYSAVPLTYDMKSIEFLLDFFDVGIAGDSTAIGDGIANGIKLLEKGDAKKKVLILITDGIQNSGAISPKEATKKAQKMGIKIYTIGIGKKTDFDEKLLKLISQNTDGKMFKAKNAKILKSIYDELNLLESSKIHSSYYLNKLQLFIYPLSLAGFLMLLLILKSKGKSR